MSSDLVNIYFADTKCLFNLILKDEARKKYKRIIVYYDIGYINLIFVRVILMYV